LRHEDRLVVIAEAPPLRVTGRSQRAAYQSPRPRKLSAEQVATIRAVARTKSLCALAPEFGVGHETLRAVSRREPRS